MIFKRSLGLESTLSIASHADVLRLVTCDKPKDVCFRTTLSKDLLVPLIPTRYRWLAHVHVAAHRVSPKSSFLNAPRGLILYLIDPIMISDECRRSCVIKYTDVLIRISLFPQLSVLAFFTLFSCFPLVLFFWNLLFSIFYFNELAFYE